MRKKSSGKKRGGYIKNLKEKSKKVTSKNFKRIVAEVVLIQLLLSFTPAPVFSFDAGKTHTALTKEALKLKIREHQGDKDFLETFGTLSEDGEYMPTSFGSKIIQGSEEEDYPEKGTLLRGGLWVKKVKVQKRKVK